MTAKEKLRQTVEELSEAEAQDALGFIVRRRGERDALADLLERAPLDDEPTTLEEDEGAREAREQIARGEVLSADEIRREIA
jgi:secreted protein with Ig-like and vWFA domain